MPDSGRQTSLYFGFLDHLSEQGVVGWVAELHRPAVPVVIDLLIDGTKVDTCLATLPRNDVRDAGMTVVVTVGFTFPIPPAFFDGQRHVISFRSSTGDELIFDDCNRVGGTKWEFCFAPSTRPLPRPGAPQEEMAGKVLCWHVRGNLDVIGADGIIGWAIDENSDIPVELDLLIDDQKVAHFRCDLPRPDVQAAGELRGDVGFVLDIPDRFHDGMPHRLCLKSDDGGMIRLGDGSDSLHHEWHFTFAKSRLRGQVDGIIDGAVHGWVFLLAQTTEGRSGGLDVLVSHQGHPLIQLHADLFRADVAERHGCDPNCGFRFVPPMGLMTASTAEFRFSVVGHDDFELANSPIRLDVPQGEMVTKLQAMLTSVDALFTQTWHLRQQLLGMLPAPPHTLHFYHDWAVDYLSRLDTAFSGQSKMDGPLVSVICPTFKPRLEDFRAAVASVQAQTYQRWELLIADDASEQPELHQAIVSLTESDKRIRWLKLETNSGISAATNAALSMATGDYVAFFDHDDLLVPQALEIMITAAARTGAKVLYSDEDKIDDQGRYGEVHFKPAWNYRLLLSLNYICHLLFVDRTHLNKVGLLNSDYDGAQDHDLILRLSEITSPDEIAHVPEVLYHWRKTPTSTASSLASKTYAVSAGKRAIADHLARRALPAEVGILQRTTLYDVSWQFDASPKVSILIPYREQVAITQKCVEAIISKTDYTNYEIVLIDNFSTSNQSVAFAKMASRLQHTRVLRLEEKFNYSRINNHAAAQANGSFLAFMNNDVMVLKPDWLRILVNEALADPNVGVVGAKLLYPSGHVQHGGVVLGVGGIADHAHRGLPQDDTGYMSRSVAAHQVSAVTGALMLCRRQAFDEVGGFDEAELPVAFNDVDLCLKIGAPNYGTKAWRIIMAPACVAEHHESLSRGSDLAPNRQVQFFHENKVMSERWKSVLAKDRFYSPHFSRRSGVYSDLEPPAGRQAAR